MMPHTIGYLFDSMPMKVYEEQAILGERAILAE